MYPGGVHGGGAHGGGVPGVRGGTGDVRRVMVHRGTGRGTGIGLTVRVLASLYG